MNEPVTIFKAAAFRAGCHAVEVVFNDESSQEAPYQILSPYSLVEIRTQREDSYVGVGTFEVMVWKKWYYALQTPNDACAEDPCMVKLIIQGEQKTHAFQAVYNGCDAYTLTKYIAPDGKRILLHPRTNPIPPDVLEDIDAGFGIIDGDTNKEAE